MKTFVFDADHNITAYASQQQANSAMPSGDAFSTAAGLKAALQNYPAATAVGIWNSLTGVTPVKRFKDAAIAAGRIFAELQKLGGPEAAPANTDVPKAKREPRGEAKPAAARKAAKKAAKRIGSEPRAPSKTAQLIGMLKRPQGVTLEEARTNLHEAVALVLEANRTLAQEAASGKDVIREPLKVSA